MRRHAVITGGGRGIGAAIAKAFDEAGIHTTLMGRNVDRLEAMAKGLLKADCRVLDVTDDKAVKEVFAALDDSVDILFLAGIPCGMFFQEEVGIREAATPGC